MPSYWLLFDDDRVMEVTYKHVKQATIGCSNADDDRCSAAYMVQYAKEEENKTQIDDIIKHTLLSPIEDLRGMLRDEASLLG